MALHNFVNQRILHPMGMKVRYSNLARHRRGRQFSYIDEERILAELIRTIGNVYPWYVDIGAMDGFISSNTAGLALDGWRGVCFEYAARSAFANLASLYQELPNVFLCNTKITPTNVSSFLKAYEVPKEFGVLSLDIDSYDYFVLESIFREFRPTIVVTEINERIPPPILFSIKYTDTLDSRKSKGEFFGQSIEKLGELCRTFDYAIDRLEYNNVFLVPSERHRGASLTPADAYRLGYVSRSDRKERFSCNHDFDALLEMSPVQALAWLERRFASFEGDRELSLREPY